MSDKVEITMELLEIVPHMTDERAGKLLKAIYNFRKDGTIEPDELVKMAFIPFMNSFIKQDHQRKRIAERNRVNGSKGGRKSTKEKPAPVDSGAQSPAKKTRKAAEKKEPAAPAEPVTPVLRISVAPFSDSFGENWLEWIAYKYIEHKKFTYLDPKTEQRAFNSLLTLSGENEEKALDIMYKSMAEKWKGFQPWKPEYARLTKDKNEDKYGKMLKNGGGEESKPDNQPGQGGNA